MRFLRRFLRDMAGMVVLATMPLLVAGAFSLLAMIGTFGPAELGRFHDQETPEEHERLRSLYTQAEAASVRRGWEESRRAGEPYREAEPGPQDEEWRYRAPWELFAALDRASDSPPGESRSLALAADLIPEYRWGRFWETWSVICTDDKGNVSHDSGASERVLLTEADFWAGSVSVVWEYETESWSRDRCLYSRTYPVLDHREYRPEWSRLETVMERLDPMPDSLAQVLELMDLYGGGNWFALLEGTESLPASAASVGPLVRDLYQARAAELPAAPPRLALPGARVTSPFGPREHPILGGMSMHTGIDYAYAFGDPIRAAGPGIVLYAGWLGGYGQAVIVGHGGGVATLYGHLSAVEVHAGMPVEDGTVIGLAGSTGISTGPHLHFEVRVDGEAVDPLQFAR